MLATIHEIPTIMYFVEGQVKDLHAEGINVSFLYNTTTHEVNADVELFNEKGDYKQLVFTNEVVENLDSTLELYSVLTQMLNEKYGDMVYAMWLDI